MTYYNEWEPFAAEWIRELIKVGELPQGTVDERTIKDVRPSELMGSTHCHFFAGIGGWPYALKLAGWPENRQVWSASCPCQPFSDAGLGLGESDERHLWPVVRDLVAECKPATIFGEQVASKAGREWLAGVRLDLEELGYAVGAADLCAASVTAPHVRQRLFWVANAHIPRHDTPGIKQEDRERALRRQQGEGQIARACYADCVPCEILGKKRRIAPGITPMANGIPNRVGRIRGTGNAIVPQVAATFIESFLEAENELLRKTDR